MSLQNIGKKLIELLGEEKVVTDPHIVSLYTKDASGLTGEYSILTLPESTEDVRKIVKKAYEMEIPIYPVGASTSLAGSPVPLTPGILLSFEKMRKIHSISIPDTYVEVEPGLRIEELNTILEEKRYMFPIDPSSHSVATIGGAINSGAGGLRGAKYGTIKDWVLQLEVVFPDEKATTLRLGCKTLKCRQGYDLVRLIVGSEGTLSIVTRAVLKITPIPENVVTILSFFDHIEDLMEFVVDYKSRGYLPYIMEFLDSETTRIVKWSLNLHDDIPDKNMLLLSIDCWREACSRLLKEALDIMKNYNPSTTIIANTLEEAEDKKMFLLRRSKFAALVAYGKKMYGGRKVIHLIEDISVPPSMLVNTVKEIREISMSMGIPVMIGGHIGDGNLHPTIVYPIETSEEKERVHEWFKQIMNIATKYNGTMSSEHGIGVLKKDFLELEFKGEKKPIEIMKEIKRVFDPKNILNPGKII